MAGFANVRELVDAELAGRHLFRTFRKAPTQATTARSWFDLSSSPGNPVAKFWFDATPLIAKTVAQSTDGGIPHGGNVAPLTKHLRKYTLFATVATTLPATYILCDYLLYYPTVDDSVLDPQIMDNTATLPRSTDGIGVQMVCLSTASRTGGATFTVEYTNQEGVTGRVTPQHVQNGSVVVGNVTNAGNGVVDPLARGPFMALQDGDTGVRSVQSVTMEGLGDTGLFSLVLVKPLATTNILGIDAPVEDDFLLSSGLLPVIEDDAFLGMLSYVQGSSAATIIHGILEVVWN